MSGNRQHGTKVCFVGTTSLHAHTQVPMVSAIVQDPTAAGYVKTIAQLVDDMAALLAGSTLQLLGGACGSNAAAGRALQASGLLIVTSCSLYQNCTETVIHLYQNCTKPVVCRQAEDDCELCHIRRHMQGCDVGSHPFVPLAVQLLEETAALGALCRALQLPPRLTAAASSSVSC